MGPTDNQPDFDNMSPEEIMAWMESLAKRQGASEGFTTAADVEVPEIDPNSVVLDEPGYVPYGQEDKVVKPAPAAQKPASPPPPSPPVQTPLPMPAAPPPVVQAPPPPTKQPLAPAASAEPSLETVMGQSTLAWLESLAADQGVGDFSLDLTSLEPEPVVRAPRTDTDPESWLQGIAAEPELPKGEIGAPEPVESLDWLDSLARRPVSAVETPPEPENLPLFASAPPEPAPSTESLILDDPSSWLDSLAVEGGFEDQALRAQPKPSMGDDLSIEAIERAIREGRVTPEQMKRYQEYSMERAAHEEVVEIDEIDIDAPAQPGELPDWLAALKPIEEPAIETPAPDRPPLESLFTDSGEPVLANEGIPDWLQDEGVSEETVESIFARPETSAIEIDYEDPWVEAFDEEYARAAAASDDVPTWYEQNIQDPMRISRVEQIVSSEAVEAAVIEPPPTQPPVASEAIVEIVQPSALAEAALPSETNLPHGERQAVPAWMRTGTLPPVPAAPSPAAAAAEVETAFAPEPTEDVMPDWLQTDEHFAAPATLWAPTEPLVETVAPVAPPPPPAARPAAVSGGTLQEARTRYQQGELDTSLAIYEGLVRTNDSLEEVSGDLARIVQAQPGNAVVHRVLGDSLMRQGRLQEALNTYRAALNSLYRS